MGSTIKIHTEPLEIGGYLSCTGSCGLNQSNKWIGDHGVCARWSERTNISLGTWYTCDGTDGRINYTKIQHKSNGTVTYYVNCGITQQAASATSVNF